MTTENPQPFSRQVRNLLVTGHRLDRLPNDQDALERISVSIEKVMQAFSEASNGFIKDSGGEKKPLRILTGLADGTEDMVAKIAKKHEFPLHVIAAHPQQEAEAANIYAERIALIKEKFEQSSSDALIAATDDAKLSLADAIIIVWDGKSPRGQAGGTVRLLIEALRRYTPVVWVDARTEFSGKIRVLDSKRLYASTLSILTDNEKHVSLLHHYFSDVESDLQSDLAQMLKTFWSAEAIAPLNAALQQANIDPGDRSTVFGIFHSHILWLTGGWKRKNFDPIYAWRGSDEFVASSQLPEEIWQWFDRVDRAATHAANKHRDHIVLINLLASFAVFCAVAGHISTGAFLVGTLGLSEFLILAFILFMIWRNQGQRMTDHDIWLHFRQAAEALRMSAILHPLLASLPTLHRNVWASSSDKSGPMLAKPYHWLVIQLLREAGTPTGREGNYCIETGFAQLSAGLRSLIADQIKYHEGAYSRYHKTHHRLHFVTVWVFRLVLLTVFVHLLPLFVESLEHFGWHVHESIVTEANWIEEQGWLLLITAFCPALAAGLHGITTKIEFQRLAKNSKRINLHLDTLRQAVDLLHAHDDTMALRAVAIETAVTMYAEHDSWAELMVDNDLEIPA